MHFLLFFILTLPLSSFCAEKENTLRDQPRVLETKKTPLWFRDAGEYISSRSTRIGLATEASPKVRTDAKRYDVTLGKRIPLLVWDEVSPSEAWALGIDGGMLASLTSYTRNGNFTFATNTFDGFFGAFLGRAFDGWIFMFHTAHLSAHLVDNSPQILTAISYSQFWNEVIIGKTFPNPEELSNWDLHIQGSVGLNNTSTPAAKQPRAALGISAGYAFSGPDALALLASADALSAGVMGQNPSYSLFLGMGSLNRPNSTHRPFRAGLAWFLGTDYRNQFYAKKQNWATFEIATDF